ncbi:uncharacterized protein LOC126900043 isoform X2 [Daktulosphaira vitifoliae]|uniref:uncharacterized protein LOC126900043 isoform X2 n=1 Tax=Daktulosphaira vitifoliae TaxID=58002 RepID=UPI0021AAEFEF|nr:uncharacterized protein LOC126900043 isoform X2 [Daktulosphaira vitifoliae]
MFLLDDLNVDELIKKNDLETLFKTIPSILNFDVNSICLSKKIFRLSQLIIEYLLYQKGNMETTTKLPDCSKNHSCKFNHKLKATYQASPQSGDTKNLKNSTQNTTGDPMETYKVCPMYNKYKVMKEKYSNLRKDIPNGKFSEKIKSDNSLNETQQCVGNDLIVSSKRSIKHPTSGSAEYDTSPKPKLNLSSRMLSNELNVTNDLVKSISDNVTLNIDILKENKNNYSDSILHELKLLRYKSQVICIKSNNEEKQQTTSDDFHRLKFEVVVFKNQKDDEAFLETIKQDIKDFVDDKIKQYLAVKNEIIKCEQCDETPSIFQDENSTKENLKPTEKISSRLRKIFGFLRCKRKSSTKKKETTEASI